MSYSTKVLEHYEQPRNIGSMDSSDNSVGTGLVGAPECGDVMKLQIKVKNDKIVDAKLKLNLLKILILWKNYPYHPLKFIVRYWQKMQLKLLSMTTRLSICKCKKCKCSPCKCK